VKKIVLADAAIGTVVRIDGNWGVVCSSDKGSHRIVDFWDGGRRHVPRSLLAEVQTKRIYGKEVAV
jgi:hypothetical protein